MGKNSIWQILERKNFLNTDMLLIITSTGDEFLRNVNIDDLE